MESVQQKAFQTYINNLNYFKQNHPELHDKIQLLNTMIEEGKYLEKYVLDYKDEGYFDVQELNTQEWLYGENSITYSHLLASTITLAKTGAVFQAQKFVDFSEDMVEIVDKSELDFHNALWATIKIIDYVRRYAPQASSSMIQVYKSIFLDIGLGIHLEEIITKLGSLVIYIKEDNLELFRLSLFVTNFSNLATNRTLLFSICEDEMSQRDSFINFLNIGNNYNLYLKHIPFNKNYEISLRNFQSYVLSQNYIMYGYSGLLLRFVDSLKYLPKNYGFINVNQTYINSIFSNKPILLLFSGPSASHNIEWVIANRNKFILVTALSTCRLLNQYHLTPDIVVHIDPGKKQTLALFEGIDITKFFKKTICIFSSNVDEETICKFSKEQVYFIEQGTNYKRNFGNFTSASVGEYTYAIFLLFGTTKMFILGLDLALDVKTLKTHADFHPFLEQGKHDENASSLSYETSIEYTKGNFIQTVPTLALYKISIQEFKRFTHMVKRSEQNVYNLGNGAYLEGATPLSISSFDWEQLKPINDPKLYKKIQQFFISASSAEFREEDKNIIRHQLQEARNLEKIIKDFSYLTFSDYNHYLSSLANLSWVLSDMEKQHNSDLSEVYYEYFQIVSSYIFDLFNTREIYNFNEHITGINAILIEQLLKMSTLYIRKLEDCVR